jgi:prepilin-type N-terminal cleavage/methylation domain-containing protein
MVFSTTSSSPRRRRGFTFVELLVAASIASVLLGSTASLLLYTARSFRGISNYVDMSAESRQALDRMSHEIRRSSRLIDFSTNSFTLEFQGDPLEFKYHPEKRTVTRRHRNATSVLLTGCDEFLATVYQRNTVAGTFDQYPIATARTAKIIELSWICTRSIIDVTSNTETVHSSKIVLRNQQ